MTDKEVLLMLIGYTLSGTYTEEGVALWWDRERSQLDGRTPRQAFDDGDVEAVARLAIGAGEMLGT